MEQNVEELERVKGDDSAAGSIADDYPDYLESFNEAAGALLTLKNAQLAQEELALGKSCSEEDKNLREAVKQFLEPQPGSRRAGEDPATGRNREEQNSRRLLEPARPGERHHQRVWGGEELLGVRKRGLVRRDQPHARGRRRHVEQVGGGAQGHQRAVRRTSTRGRSMCSSSNRSESCRPPALNSKKLLEDILKDWVAWKESRRDLAAKYVVNADKIRMAICDDDEEQITSRVEDAEKAAQGNLKGGYETLYIELVQLVQRIGKLERRQRRRRRRAEVGRDDERRARPGSRRSRRTAASCRGRATRRSARASRSASTSMRSCRPAALRTSMGSPAGCASTA